MFEKLHSGLCSSLMLVLISPLAQAATDCAAVTEVPRAECEALVALYNSTDGDNWLINTGWNVTNTPCDWYGVECSDGHVSMLNLPFNQLSGSIPPELGDLSGLESIWASDNQLSGSIPSELGQLSNLQIIWLSGNQLSGPIPPILGGLSNLQSLLLSDNQLSGTIPPELGNLSLLENLWLSGNQLSGIIPPELGNLGRLKVLWLHSNQFYGPIPSVLGGLSNLQVLWLTNNQLCGEIPSELMNLENLLALNLPNNNLINSDTAYDANFVAWLDQNWPDWRDQESPSYCSGILQFASDTYSVAENGGSVTIAVERVGGSDGDVCVKYRVVDSDTRIITEGTVCWKDGEQDDKGIEISVPDDGDSVGNKTLTISLIDPDSGESLGSATITVFDDDTTLVTLVDFAATALETGIFLEWQTTFEFDNAGFHIWRAAGEGWRNGNYLTVIRLTESLLPAQGYSSFYDYIDADVETGVTYYYGLEDIDLNGQSTIHWGLIVSATAQ